VFHRIDASGPLSGPAFGRGPGACAALVDRPAKGQIDLGIFGAIDFDFIQVKEYRRFAWNLQSNVASAYAFRFKDNVKRLSQVDPAEELAIVAVSHGPFLGIGGGEDY
jgi:hypothetical protein